MKIRKATIADYSVLVAIDTVAHHQRQRRDQIRSWILAQQCYVIEGAESIIGYGVLTYHFLGNGFIEVIMVAECSRRQGAGTSLVAFFRKICETPKLFTSANESNGSMRELLIRSGFRESGVIENLDENDPEIIYVSIKI